jgi:hypothetical protein
MASRATQAGWAYQALQMRNRANALVMCPYVTADELALNIDKERVENSPSIQDLSLTDAMVLNPVRKGAPIHPPTCGRLNITCYILLLSMLSLLL